MNKIRERSLLHNSSGLKEHNLVTEEPCLTQVVGVSLCVVAVAITVALFAAVVLAMLMVQYFDPSFVVTTSVLASQRSR